ncbi:MAG: cation diffusion facilitator family transporter, partial [Lachnospiraceae bacterium]|nr:cation diffusion facilitator family transporter [Lachnospiraceae bacterium]
AAKIKHLMPDRNYKIITYNILGIVLNLFLSVGKISVGMITNAHAVMLDGFNSFTDMVSEILAILSTFISAKKADATHPFGYGRLEYLCSFIITMLVINVGIRGFFRAIKAIIHPHQAPLYSSTLIIIMIISLIVKLIYGLLMRIMGKKLKSDSMIMTGTDSIGDAMIAVAILIGIAIYYVLGTDIEHYLCVVISILILKTGVEMAKECITKLLGTKVDKEYKKRIMAIILSEDRVLNVCNLVIHTYGEEVSVGSVDIEVDANMTASEVNSLSIKLKRMVLDAGLILTSVGIVGSDTKSPEAIEMWDKIIELSVKHKEIERVHSFTLDPDNKVSSFYIVNAYRDINPVKTRDDFLKELSDIYPDIDFIIEPGMNL